MITNQLVDKKIVYLSARTFNLEHQIKSKLESHGATVLFFDERIQNNTLTKAVIRIKKSFYKKRITAYYRGILAQTKDIEVDFLFVVRGEVVPDFFLVAFRKQHPNATFIFYNWDSFKNTPYPVKTLHLYDRKFSFDPEDARKYGMCFRPLYYTDDYAHINTDVEKRCDLFFIGTAHSDRYVIGTVLKKFLEANGRMAYCYYFMHSKWVYYYKKLFDKTFKYVDISKLSFKSLSLGEILKRYEISKAILDVNHPYQKGLTMRTFEAIGAKRKLITTNEEIRKFPFCTPDNVYILDRNDPKVDLSFFDSPYQEIDEDLYRRLSLSGWLYNLFVNDEADYWKQFV